MGEFTLEFNDSNFDDQVIKAVQPVLVDFWAEWCGPCKQLTPKIDSVAEDFNGRAKIGKVNVDESPTIAASYGIRSIPSLLFFKDGIVQKQLVAKSNEAGKISVIATQMLWSMVVAPAPTRAEISDVTNAVLDRCDAVMLSDETAVGQHPLEAFNMADATVRETETIYPYFSDLGSRDRTQAITSAAARMVRSLDSKPVVVTSTGRAAFELARFRPDADIIAFSHDGAVLQKLCMGWGIRPGGVIPPQRDVASLVASVVQAGLDGGTIEETDVVTIVHGFSPGVSGTTNAVQVLDMREYLAHVQEERAATTQS